MAPYAALFLVAAAIPIGYAFWISPGEASRLTPSTS